LNSPRSSSRIIFGRSGARAAAGGSYAQKEEKGQVQTVELSISPGEQALKEFIFTLTPTLQPKKLVALKGEAGGRPFTPVFKQERNRIKVTWTQPLVLKAGDKLARPAEF
jgi:hypothetical protein